MAAGFQKGYQSDVKLIGDLGAPGRCAKQSVSRFADFKHRRLAFFERSATQAQALAGGLSRLGADTPLHREELGLGEVPTIASEAYLRTFERALVARGVPFAWAGGEGFEQATSGARWVICATAGGVKPELFERMTERKRAGAIVTIGPRVPTRDGRMRDLDRPFDAGELEVEPLEDAAQADVLVARRIEELGLPTYPVDPDDVFVSLHHDAAGVPRVAFVMNPNETDRRARVALGRGVKGLVDAVVHGKSAGQTLHLESGAFSVSIPSRTVRIFAIEPA